MKVEVRVKDTRASLVKYCTGNTWHFPGAPFPLTDEERANTASQSVWVGGSVGGTEQADEPGDDAEAPGDGDGEDGLPGSDDPADNSQSYAVAAE